MLAGNLDSTAIAQPIAAHFGRGKNDTNFLNVRTVGGSAVSVNRNIVIGPLVGAVVSSIRK